MNIPSDVQVILHALDAAGYSSYVVGGCVRDSLMGIEPHDWDIATSALPEEVKIIFPHNYETGIQHGTITVLLGKKSYEITTYRIDGAYRDFRRPEAVSFTNDIEEDLSRRDFTINAIAYRPTAYVDPYHGAEDIRNKIIRGVGDPNLRFQEDALRMLRALRFSARLSFHIEENTYAAIIQNAYLISYISMERIREELNGLLTSPHPEKLSALIKCGLMQYIFPGLNDYFQQKLSFITDCLKMSPPYTIMSFSILFVGLPSEQAATYMALLRFDNKTIKAVRTVVEWAYVPLQDNYYAIRKMINGCGPLYFEHILTLQKIMAAVNGLDTCLYDRVAEKHQVIVHDNHCLSLQTLAVKGHDLQAIGVHPGKDMGIILNELLDLVLLNPDCNTKPVLLEKARIIHAHNS